MTTFYSAEYAIAKVMKEAFDTSKDSGRNKLIASTTKSVLLFLGIGNSSSRSSDVVGTLVTPTGDAVIRDESLPSSILNAKLNKTVKLASQDFDQQWKASTGVPIDFISNRFSHLKIGKQDVVVTP